LRLTLIIFTSFRRGVRSIQNSVSNYWQLWIVRRTAFVEAVSFIRSIMRYAGVQEEAGQTSSGCAVARASADRPRAASGLPDDQRSCICQERLTAREAASAVAIELHSLNAAIGDSVTVNPHEFPLAGLVAVQPASGSPPAVHKGALLDGEDAGDRSPGRVR